MPLCLQNGTNVRSIHMILYYDYTRVTVSYLLIAYLVAQLYSWNTSLSIYTHSKALVFSITV